MEADLSEHFGRIGEFFAGLVGLILLLLIHPAIRKSAAARLTLLGRSIVRMHRHVCATSFTYRSWSAAFHMIFRERRGLLLILFALIAFDYFADFYDWLIEKFVIAPLYDRASLADMAWEEIMHISLLHAFSLSWLVYFGYALFGWLAYQRAQGADYRKAATFRPRLRLLGFALMVIGLGTLTDHLSPSAVRSIGLAEDSAYLLYLVGALSGGLVLLLLGARIFNAPRGWKIHKSVVAACAGFFLLTQLVRWLHHLSFIAARHFSDLGLVVLHSQLNDFTSVVLSSIAFLGFSLVLANPTALNE